MFDAKLSCRSLLAAGAAGAAAAAFPTLALATDASADAATAGKPKVYFTKDLSAAGLAKMAALVKAPLTGKIAVKLHTGEPNAPYILPRPWVKAVTDSMSGCTIVECNVAYGSPRARTETHRELLRENGWTFCPVDIMDAEGDVPLPVKNGLHLKEVAFGKHILDYDSMLVLTHFKGHSMGGYGGSLKNISIGCASGRTGKRQLHGSGWETGEPFMERMADGGKALVDHFKGRMAFVNVMRAMSVDCDCAGAGADAPEVPDVGILASTDLLAVEQATIDMLYSMPEDVRRPLQERIESRKGLRQLSAMKDLGMGTGEYELVAV